MDWIGEVEELHAFFEAYFLGAVSSHDRVEVALASSYTMIGPDGRLSTRSEIVDMIVAGHAHTDSLSIETSEHRLVADRGEVLVGTYVETHHLADRRNDRRTTAVFLRDPSAPNGVRWLHAQETWLP